MFKNIKEWKTTLMGVITIILFALVSFNFITTEQSAVISESLQNVTNAAGGDTMVLLAMVFGSISGILNLFVKDPKKNK